MERYLGYLFLLFFISSGVDAAVCCKTSDGNYYGSTSCYGDSIKVDTNLCGK